MPGLDHWCLSRRTLGARSAGTRLARLPVVGVLGGVLALLACNPPQTGPGGRGATVPGTTHASDTIGLQVLADSELEKLASSTEVDLPGELVRSGRYLYSHGDVAGGFETIMAEDFAVARVAGGHVGKAYIYGPEPAQIAFTLDEDMRLRSLFWRCECEAPQLYFASTDDQLVIATIRDGVRQSSEHIALQYDWTLTQFQILSWAMIGSADLQAGSFRTWHMIDIDQSGQASLYGTTVITRHEDKPLPEPSADDPATQFYTAEPIIDDAEENPELGPDPPEQIWTDALGCPLLTLDESADAARSQWRMDLVPIPEDGATPPPAASTPAAERAAVLAQGEMPPALAEQLDAALATPCPPATPQPHCIVLTLRPGAEARAAELIARAARDGIEVQREGNLWSAHLADADIVRHFGGRVVYKRVAASASNTGSADQCNAYLEGAQIPPRYARYLASVAVGHQICE